MFMLEDYGLFFQTCEVGELPSCTRGFSQICLRLDGKVKEKDFSHNLATCWNPFSKYGHFFHKKMT
jgi:hypothetical protein